MAKTIERIKMWASENVRLISLLPKETNGLEKTKLSDILEYDVDEKFFLSDEKTDKLVFQLEDKDKVGMLMGNTNPSSNGMNGNVYNADGLSPTLTTNKGEGSKILIKEATKKGYAIAETGDSINFEHPNSKTRRGRVGKGVAQTLTTSCNQGTLDGYRIRKLTPRECWRLQGFPDSAFDKAQDVNSDSQLYKQAGNSVTVNVIAEIANKLEDA